MSSVVAIIAAYNRADTVGATVSALRAVAAIDEVVVVDDGSRDGTAEQAESAGARVVRLAANRGKGGAVAAGVAATPDAHVYLLVDADVGSTAGTAGALLGPVLSGEADMAIGVLPPAGGRGGFGLVRELASAGIRRAIRPHPFRPQAPLSGQRAVAGEVMRKMTLAPRFGMEVALTIDAVRAGARVVEVPVAMDHRHTGRGLSGFLHRARQGANVARALWPRVTSTRFRVAIIVAATMMAIGMVTCSGTRWEPASVAPASGVASDVLIIGVPGLAWRDIGTGAMPNLDRLVQRGALAAMTVRTRSPFPGVAEGYASLGAGSRVRTGPEAGAAFELDDGGIAVAGAEQLRQRAGRFVPSRPGALGAALRAAGRRTAVVGNADIAPNLTGTVTGGAIRRPAALAVMDTAGRIDGGAVSAALLTSEPGAPFGLRANTARIVEAARAALAGHDVVLVDTGDMERARHVAELGAAPALAATARHRALSATDQVLGHLTGDGAGLTSTLVLVVSVVPPGAEWRLAPLVASGVGVRQGYLHSPSTKRLGLVALTDVAPTILHSIGAPVPPELIGHPLRYHPGSPDIARLARLDRDAAFRERIYYSAALGFILFQVVAYSLFLAAGHRRRPPRRWLPALRVIALAIVAFPLATFLFRAVPFAPRSGSWWVVLLIAIDTGLVAMATRATKHPLAPLSWLLGATAFVLMADVATGARLQTASILGYSPHTAARFFGLGNTAFAALAASAILAAALHLEHAPRRREALVAVGGFFLLVALVDGAPWLGDDVGGMLTLVPVLGLTLVAFAGRRVTWRTVACVMAATAALTASAAVVDLLRPPESRTHLGRAVSDTLNHGRGSLFTTMARKTEVNLRVMTATIWAWVVPVIAGYLLVLLGWQRKASEILPLGSFRRIGAVSAICAGLLGAVVNDSGVVVTAVVLVYVGAVVATIALGGSEAGSSAAGPPPTSVVAVTQS